MPKVKVEFTDIIIPACVTDAELHQEYEYFRAMEDARSKQADQDAIALIEAAGQPEVDFPLVLVRIA